MSFLKKLLLISGAILIAYLVLMTAYDSYTYAPDAAAADSASVAAHEGYLVTGDRGRIVVFRGKELYMSTDTQISSLPKADRVKLVEGIHIDSEKELKALLEDYCS